MSEDKNPYRGSKCMSSSTYQGHLRNRARQRDSPSMTLRDRYDLDPLTETELLAVQFYAQERPRGVRGSIGRVAKIMEVKKSSVNKYLNTAAEKLYCSRPDIPEVARKLGII